MKPKILISIITLIISSVIGVILVNTIFGTLPYEGKELWGFYLVECGMVIIMPVLGLNNLWWFGTWDSFVTFTLAIFSFVWLIYLLIKSERKWIVSIPVVTWVLIGSWNTFLALVASV